ncbi:unnamed protein product [Owenia fusiformis]|uniref:Uncharacterized protein n=1 Tax=Owenia fusiformis TaxID=6347 RepID=A0A8S4NST0_OWEFU|nr:unnamed protein product [Owenia fusiformis]
MEMISGDPYSIAVTQQRVDGAIKKVGEIIKITLSLSLCSVEDPDVCTERLNVFTGAQFIVPTATGCGGHSTSPPLGGLENLVATIDGGGLSDLMKDIRGIYRKLLDDDINKMLNDQSSEDFESYDVCLDGEMPFGPKSVTFFDLKMQMMVGPIPLVFGFRGGGSIGVVVSCRFCILSMKVTGGVRPEMGITVSGSLGVGLAILSAEVRIIGHIMTTAFPTRVGIGFSKFPLDASMGMDLELTPLRLALETGLTSSIVGDIFMINVWQYTTPVHRVIHLIFIHLVIYFRNQNQH